VLLMRKKPIVVVLKPPKCFGVEKQSEKCNRCVHCFDCIERRSENETDRRSVKRDGCEV